MPEFCHKDWNIWNRTSRLVCNICQPKQSFGTSVEATRASFSIQRANHILRVSTISVLVVRDCMPHAGKVQTLQDFYCSPEEAGHSWANNTRCSKNCNMLQPADLCYSNAQQDVRFCCLRCISMRYTTFMGTRCHE